MAITILDGRCVHLFGQLGLPPTACRSVNINSPATRDASFRKSKAMLDYDDQYLIIIIGIMLDTIMINRI